nr:hypothetical protein [Tanacetum cinerariifolium]
AENYACSIGRTGTSANRERISWVQIGEGQSVSSYVLKMNNYLENLKRLDQTRVTSPCSESYLSLSV